VAQGKRRSSTYVPYEPKGRLVRHILELAKTGVSIFLLPHMPNEKDKQEQQLLWKAALKAIGDSLRRDLHPEQDAPGRLRELISQLEAHAAPKSNE
jgi:hypothetical protein